jgi:hypothetical protein
MWWIKENHTGGDAKKKERKKMYCLYEQFKKLPKFLQEDIAQNAEKFSDNDLQSMYDETLNEIYGKISICNLDYPASYALKSVDPIAYDCGFSDYLATSDHMIELNGVYYAYSDIEAGVEMAEHEIELAEEEAEIEAQGCSELANQHQ